MHALVDFLHEGVEMHPALFADCGVVDEQVHDHGLAAANSAPKIKPCWRGYRLGKKAGKKANPAVGIGFEPKAQGFKLGQDRVLGRIGPQLPGGDAGIVDFGQAHAHGSDYRAQPGWERLSDR